MNQPETTRAEPKTSSEARPGVWGEPPGERKVHFQPDRNGADLPISYQQEMTHVGTIALQLLIDYRKKYVEVRQGIIHTGAHSKPSIWGLG